VHLFAKADAARAIHQLYILHRWAFHPMLSDAAPSRFLDGPERPESG
jgi:hypothetical protein